MAKKKKNDELSLQDFFKLMQDNSRYLQYVLLLVIVLTGYMIRTADIEHLGDQLLGLDPYVFYRYGQEVVDYGAIRTNDTMRYYPFGFDTSSEGTLHSYVMAWMYLGLKPILGWELINAFQLYPAIFGALAFVAFYFLVREVFGDVKIALVATAMLSVIPSFLFRTAGGFADKEAIAIFLIFSALFFYVKSNNQKDKRFRRLFAILAGVSTGLCGLSWGGVIFVFESIAAFAIIEVIFDRITKEKFETYAFWVMTMFPFFIFMTNRYGGLLFFRNSMTLPPLFALFLAFFRLYLYPKIEKFRPDKIPTGIFAMIVGTLILAGIAAVVFGPDFIVSTVDWIVNTFAYSSGTRHAESVSENQPPYFYDPQRNIDWWSSVSYFILPFFGGAFLVMYNFMKPFKKYRLWIALMFFGFVMFFIFSRFSSLPEYDSLNTLFAENYIYAFYLFVIAILLFYVKIWDQKKKIAKLETNYIIIMVWLILGIVAARAAVRNIFSVTPALVAFGAFFIVKGFDMIREKTGEWIYGSLLYVFLGVLLFAGFNASYGTVANSFWSGMTPDWLSSMNWINDNTASDAVFIHWWDYGYWVQSVGNRTTVLDGGNYEAPNRAAEHFFTSSNVTEYRDVLEYYSNPTHMLICDDDVLKFYQIARIGLKDVWFSPFVSSRQISSSQIQGGIINATKYPTSIEMNPISGIAPITGDMYIGGKLFAAWNTYVQGILVPFGNNTFGDPLGLVVNPLYGAVLVPFNCVCYREIGCQDIRDDGIPDCVLYIQQGVIYMPNITRDMLFTQTYMLNMTVPGFNRVYDNGLPFDIQGISSQGRTQIQVWEIDYDEMGGE